jgi:hypothetical protein
MGSFSFVSTDLIFSEGGHKIFVNSLSLNIFNMLHCYFVLGINLDINLILSFNSFLLLLYSGCIVTFMKVLTIHHSWIHPLHHSPLFPLPHSCNTFNRSHFSIYIHVYVIFPAYSPAYTFFVYPSTGTNTPRQDLSIHLILLLCQFFDFCACKFWSFFKIFST